MAAKGPDFKPGEMLPGTKYRIVKQIGAGGMGIVYQVVKPPSIMGVLKLMSSDLTEHDEYRTRFLDEVRVLAQLDHPNIVKVFDYDTLPDGTPFYVMELLHGRTVRDVLGTMGTLPPRVAFEVTRQLCEALHCAHTHDIVVVHRDIKPENIFLHAPRHGEPVVKLIDFGVIAVADRAHDGTFVGTWKYAAPEQIRGERATAATDLYAVGLVLYEMLCGIGPFEHLDSGELVSQAHLREIPAPVSKFAPWVPPSIVQLIASALAKEPRQRPRDAHAFAERLYELEWANDGKDPNDRTAEGPLSRILSTAGRDKPSNKNLVTVPRKDRLGNVPVLGIPEEARHDGPTVPGVGGQNSESTVPGEDALLAGLVARPDVLQRSTKARHSDASLEGPSGEASSAARSEGDSDANANADCETTDTAGADALSEATTGKLASATNGRPYDTDTFSSQESDAQRAPRRPNKLALPIAVAAIGIIGAASFAAYHGGGTKAHAGSAAGEAGERTTGSTTALVAMPPEPTTAAPVAPAATAATAAISTAAAAVVATATLTAPTKTAGSAARSGKPQGAAAAPRKAAPAKDDSFVRGL